MNKLEKQNKIFVSIVINTSCETRVLYGLIKDNIK